VRLLLTAAAAAICSLLLLLQWAGAGTVAGARVMRAAAKGLPVALLQGCIIEGAAAAVVGVQVCQGAARA
jgi:hypothetical protein